MSFKEHYSIFPHGIRFEESTNTPYAVFKMMVTIEHNKTFDPKELKEHWYDLKNGGGSRIGKGIDELLWSFEVDANRKILNIKNDYEDPEPLKSEIKFIHKHVDETNVEDRSFRFGEGFLREDIPNQYHDPFKPLFEKVDFQWTPPKNPTQRLRQMGDENVLVSRSDEDLQRYVGEDRYGAILKMANEYARNQESNMPFLPDKTEISYQDDLVEFMSTYGSILDEPEAAEIRFGLIRAFAIPISEFLENEDILDFNFTYEIHLNSEDTKVNSQLIGEQNKFFNGLFEFYYRRDLFVSDGIKIQFFDPYNQFLNNKDQKNNPHPDGMYLIVKYENLNDQNDPFNDDTKKGFNVITNVNGEDGYHSLSFHEKSFEFLNDHPSSYSLKTSGVMTPEGEILTEQARFRSNVLFAWRGDNLIVNRIIPQSASDDGRFDEMQTISEYETEGFMVSKELYTKDEKLVPGTQIQLYDRGPKYNFYLRSVTPTGYYVPLKNEIKFDQTPSNDYLLSFEDLKRIFQLEPFVSSFFNVTELNQIPIKKLNILGSKSYGNTVGTEEVDGHQHLVLRAKLSTVKEGENKTIQSELKEAIRYIYPPKIKFEDFRFHGWLSGDRLGLPPNTTSEQFAKICLAYEQRSAVLIPEVATGGISNSIEYLSDIRGSLLAILPGDLFTINYLIDKYGNGDKPYAFVKYIFGYNWRHPYYKDSFPGELKFEKQSDGKKILSIKLNDGQDSSEVHNFLADGIYTFRNYCTDENSSGYRDKLDYILSEPHSYADVKVSSVAKPPEPILSGIDPLKEKYLAARSNELEWQNSWFHIFSLKGSKEESHLWKSIKFLETTTSLKLTENESKLKELLATNVPKESLLTDEYPYDLFLTDEIDSQLKTSISPTIVNIVIQFEDAALDNLVERDNDELRIIKVMFNDNDMLEVFYNGSLFISKADTNERIGLEINSVNELKLFHDPVDKIYKLIKKNGDFIMNLSKPVDPSISIHSCEVISEVMDYLVLRPDDNKVRLDRTNEFIFINDEGHPYYRKKSISLFGSSIFQGYYPSVKDELSIGTKGMTFYLEVPNNIRPSAPVLDSDVLLIQKSTNGSSNKRYSVGNVARILLERDFMKEGMNKLGIILKKSDGGNNDSSSSSVSEIGEDITKLTSVDWSKDNLRDSINFDSDTVELKKYFSEESIHFYEIENEVYEVLECVPYYNTQLKMWQVLIPLDLRKSETLFVKISAIKIAPGHNKTGLGSSINNPFKDSTKTNWSEISDATHLPIYNAKKYRIIAGGIANNEVRVFSDSSIEYKEKTYCILAKTNKGPVVNLFKNDSSNSDKLNDFLPFAFKRNQSGNYSEESGKVLITSNLKDEISLKIDSQKTDSIIILEFENHDNAKVIGKDTPEYLDKNPLFDYEGLRLINMAEFML